MIAILTALALLGATSAAPSEALQLAAPGLATVNLPRDVATFYSDHFAQQLTLEGLHVVSASEIATLLGLERQKTLLGCSDNAANCTVELANALGVDGVVTGSLGKFGRSYQLNLKVLSAKDASTLAAYSTRVSGGDEALLDELTRAAKQITAEVYLRLHRTPPAVGQNAPTVSVASSSSGTSSSGSSRRERAWSPAAAGLLAAGGGVALLVSAGAQWSALTGGDGAGPQVSSLSPAEAQAADRAGRSAQLLGTVLLGVGAAGLLAGGAMWLFGPSDPAVQPLAWVTPGQGGFGFAGVWP